MTTTYTMYPGNFLEGTIRSCKAVYSTGTEGSDQLPTTTATNTGKQVPAAGVALAGLGQIDAILKVTGGTDMASGGVMQAFAWNPQRESWARWPDMDKQISGGTSAVHWSADVNSRDWIAYLPVGFADAMNLTITGSLKVRR